MRSLLLVLFIACGGKSEPPPQSPISNQAPATAKPAVEPVQARKRPDCDATEDGGKCAMKFVSYFSEEMCACKDKACADRTNDEFTKWGTEMAKTATGKTSEKPDPELAKKMTEAVSLYSDCYTKLAMAAMDPNAGSGGAP